MTIVWNLRLCILSLKQSLIYIFIFYFKYEFVKRLHILGTLAFKTPTCEVFYNFVSQKHEKKLFPFFVTKYVLRKET